jgi:hypothetical protein
MEVYCQLSNPKKLLWSNFPVEPQVGLLEVEWAWMSVEVLVEAVRKRTAPCLDTIHRSAGFRQPLSQKRMLYHRKCLSRDLVPELWIVQEEEDFYLESVLIRYQ